MTGEGEGAWQARKREHMHDDEYVKFRRE